MWLIGMMGVAQAGGLAVGGIVGAELPTREVSSLDPGPAVGLLVGYRADLLVLHLQPEAQIIYSTVTPGVEFNVGGAVTVLSPLAIGAAAHLGISPGNGPTMDLLGVIEFTMLPKIKPSLRAGVQNVSYNSGSEAIALVQAVVTIAF